MTQGGGYQYPEFGSSSSEADRRGQGSQHSDDPYAIREDDGYSDPYAAPSSASSAPGYQPSPSPAYQSSFQQGPGYGQPAYAPGPPSSSHAVVGMVLGIVSIALCAGVTAPIGLIFSILGMRETSPTATEPKGGRGLAIAGLVTSILGCLVLLFVVAYFVLVIGVGIAASTS